jgi:hypothetical protein
MRIDCVIAARCLAEEPAARLPLLEKLLARGDPWSLPHVADLSACLAALFALPRASVPIAALGLLGEGVEPGREAWVRLDPVHLRAERSQLRLVPLAPHALSAADAERFAAALAPHFAAEGMALRAPQPQQWYLSCDGRADPATACPQRAAGILEQERLPRGADGAFWRRLMTEAQMLLHDSPLNAEREARGELAVNGVWPWAGGTLPTQSAGPYRTVHAGIAYARGLGRLAGALAASLPADASWTEQGGLPALLVLSSPADGPLAQIEQTWIAPAVRALEQGRCDELRLALLGPDTSSARRLTRHHLRRWWRRAKPIAGHA